MDYITNTIRVLGLKILAIALGLAFVFLGIPAIATFLDRIHFTH